MDISNALPPSVLAQRDSLLGATLRPDGSPFSIAAEYPTVLGHENTSHSYCLLDRNRVVAHANLWPRQLVDRQQRTQLRVGLIGNVATAPQLQGQGIMTNLLKFLKTEAEKSGLDALLLWSDLARFYQKLGYESFSQEHRYQISIVNEENSSESFPFFAVNAAELRNSELQRMLSLRPPVPLTIARSIGEFRQFLGIPATVIYCCYRQNHLIGFAIVGKGCDMIGVIHEWGCDDPALIQPMLRSIGRSLGLAELTVLAPATLPEEWRKALSAMPHTISEHTMALACYLSKRAKGVVEFDDTFIWGLDSI